MRRYVLVGLAIVVALGLVAVYAVWATRVSVRVGNIIVEPSSGTVGTKVTVIGQGWAPGQEIQISLIPPGGKGEHRSIFGVTHSDPEGGFQFSFPFPSEEEWAKLPWAQVMANARGVDLTASAPFVLVSETPTRTPGPVVIDALAATYFPLIHAPAEVVRQMPQVEGRVLDLQLASESSLFAFDIQGEDGEVYHVRLAPELVVMRASAQDSSLDLGKPSPDMLGIPGVVQISPTFTGMELLEGQDVAVTGIIDGAELVAESITILDGGESRMWYYRSFLEEGELPYGPEIGLGGQYVWVKTSLSAVPELTRDPVDSALEGYEDQMAVMGGHLQRRGGPVLSDVVVFIKPSRFYERIYPEGDVDIPH